MAKQKFVSFTPRDKPPKLRVHTKRINKRKPKVKKYRGQGR
jgi:hypothetical protein